MRKIVERGEVGACICECAGRSDKVREGLHLWRWSGGSDPDGPAGKLMTVIRSN